MPPSSHSQEEGTPPGPLLRNKFNHLSYASLSIMHLQCFGWSLVAKGLSNPQEELCFTLRLDTNTPKLTCHKTILRIQVYVTQCSITLFKLAPFHYADIQPSWLSIYCSVCARVFVCVRQKVVAGVSVFWPIVFHCLVNLCKLRIRISKSHIQRFFNQ